MPEQPIVFSPRLYNPVTEDILIFPTPITTFNVSDQFRWESHEIPGRDGGRAYDGKLKPSTVTFGGLLERVDATVLCGEVEKFEAYETVRDFIRNVPVVGFWLYYAYNDAQDFYRCFKSVKPVSFGWDFGDDSRIETPYSLQFQLTDDVEIYDTAPPT